MDKRLEECKEGKMKPKRLAHGVRISKRLG